MTRSALAIVLLTAATTAQAQPKPTPAPAPAPTPPAPAPAPPAPVPPAPQPPSVDRVRMSALVKAGNDLATNGRPREALLLFNDAYRAFPDSRIFLNIGQAHRDLREYVESARAYQRFLDDPARDVSQDGLAQASLAALDQLVTRVTLDIQTAGADPVEIKLDGGTWEAAPVSLVIRVAPGLHHLEARGGGVTFVAQTDFNAVAGVPVIAPLRLQLDPPPVVADPPPPVEDPAPPPTVTDAPTAEPPVATIAVVSGPPRPPGRFGALVHVAVQTEAQGATGVIGATFTPRDRLTLAIGGMAGGNYAGFATATYAFLPGALRPTATLGAIVSFYHRDPDPAQAGVFGAMSGLDAIYPGLHAAVGAEWVLSRRVSAIAEIALDFYPSVDELPGGDPAIEPVPITPTVGLHARL